jgi:fatty-acid peroxygenase
MLKDQTTALLRQGYAFACSLPDAATTSAREIRLMGRRALLVRGEDGARLFYDGSRTRRKGAIPAVVRFPLFGRGAVHGLDDARHHDRKQLFLQVLTPAAVELLAESVQRQWDGRSARWPGLTVVPLYDEAVRLLAAAVLDWAGVPTDDAQRESRAWDLAHMVDGFGSVGGRHVRSQRARRRSERWAGAAIRASRADERSMASSPLEQVARWTDSSGARLSERLAAVELLNLLRPTVAIAYFVSFAAVALHEHPQWRDRVGSHGNAADREAFVHELRRLYPFVPALAAKARTSFEWNGFRLRRGERIVLDVLGTDHDPERWPDPGSFDPERFLRTPPSAFDFVPQGGGEPVQGHRCPGEPSTIAILGVCARGLADLDYDLRPEDTRFPLERMPTRPLSGPALRAVQPRAGTVTRSRSGVAATSGHR